MYGILLAGTQRTLYSLNIHPDIPSCFFPLLLQTILGLLYAVGAEFLLDETSVEARYWPAYASHLVFELVRVAEENDSKTNHDTTNPTTHVIRVLLNGKPVQSVDFDTRKLLGHGPEHLLSIDDFSNIVSSLEDAGGHDYDRLLGRTT